MVQIYVNLNILITIGQFFMLKKFQYLGPKFVPNMQNVSIPLICILLIPVNTYVLGFYHQKS